MTSNIKNIKFSTCQLAECSWWPGLDARTSAPRGSSSRTPPDTPTALARTPGWPAPGFAPGSSVASPAEPAPGPWPGPETGMGQNHNHFIALLSIEYHCWIQYCSEKIAINFANQTERLINELTIMQ